MPVSKKVALKFSELKNEVLTLREELKKRQESYIRRTDGWTAENERLRKLLEEWSRHIAWMLSHANACMHAYMYIWSYIQTYARPSALPSIHPSVQAGRRANRHT